MYKATSFIHGNIVDNKNIIEIFSPLNGELIGSVPNLDEKQIQEAFNSAEIAFDNWKQIDPLTKKKYLLLFAEKLQQNKLLLANLINLETGKSQLEAHDEVERSIKYIVETIHEYDDLIDNPESYTHSSHIQIPENLSATYLRIPRGVALTISPFNYPMNLMITKIVPAILMGNSVVHKSATQGSLTGWYISKIFNELSYEKLQITPGVLNYITASGKTIGSTIIKNEIISSFSFTGSTNVGLQLSKQLPLVPKQLEMGGLNSAIVLKDADIDFCVSEILKGAFTFSGQRCTSIKKVIVHKSIYSSFIKLIKEKIEKYNKDFAPLINKQSVKNVKDFYIDAINKGATLITEEIDWETKSDLFVSPIIFSEIKKNMSVYEEELFGPILGIIQFEELQEAIEITNDTVYGLQASIFSENIDVSTNVSLSLDVGRVNINQAPSRSPDILPFSALKQSGKEVQGIVNSLYFFSQFKGVVYKARETN